MEGALLSAATGALQPVLGKLAALLGDEYKRFRLMRSDIEFLTHELAAMDALLLKMSEVEDADIQDKAWMKEVRELSYDIEDNLDEFMTRVGDKSAKPDGFMDKIKKLLDRTKIRHQIAKAIEDLKRQVVEAGERHARYEAGERHARYEAGEAISSARNATVNQRALAIFENVSKLVGIDGSKDEIIQLLKEEIKCESMQQQPKVVSIVGFGGIGKTTLAYRVYQELKGQFECHAFLSVSRNPDMMKVLKNILSQVNKNYSSSIDDIPQLITEISKFLAEKRYFIVVDDIWDVKTWDVIKYAFPMTCCDSKIITTTRINDVAEKCCSSLNGHIYNIRPLHMVHSRQLFYGRLFNAEEKCPSHLVGVSGEILEKCAGLPLAIIAISGLLANKSGTKDHWDEVKNSIGRALERNSSVEGLLNILSLSYFDLPHHLKTCLLYLSIFPEDHTIQKEDLVRRWIGEGFIHKQAGYTLQQSGEMCFNELVNRSLIQPVKTGKINEVKSCRVHDMILDFIVSKSIEENFVTLIGIPGVNPDPRNKVRRLSLHNDCEIPKGLVLSSARSLNLFGSKVKIPSMLEFRFLRVLSFEECGQLRDHHLADIGNLFHLRYLRLKNTEVIKLPKQIAELQSLETLDIQGSTRIPPTIWRLPRLVRLVICRGIILPDVIGPMPDLQELEGLSVYIQPTHFLERLGELTNLRKLGISFINYDGGTDWEDNDLELDSWENITTAIISSIYKLSKANLHSLHVCSNEEADALLKNPWCSPASASLRELVIEWDSLKRVPRWMGSLVNLQKLNLPLHNFTQEDAEILGSLPDLRYLRIEWCWDEPDGDELKAALERAIEAHPNHPTFEWIIM